MVNNNIYNAGTHHKQEFLDLKQRGGEKWDPQSKI